MTLETIKIPVFKRSVVIANKRHALKNSGCRSLSDYDAITYQKKGVVFVYFGKSATVESVAHEAVHIANAVINDCKLYYSSEEDELLAYLVGYLTRELMECIR